MEHKFFDQEQPLWRFLNRVTDVLILAFMWTVTSLPVVTLGASSTAVYYVVLKMVRNEEGYLWKGYWKSFKQNLKQATALWLLIFALALGFAGASYYYYMQENTIASGIQALFMGLMLVLVLVFIYVFPIVSRFSNTTGKLLSMAAFMPFKHIGYSLVLLVLFAVFAFLAWYIIPFAVFAYGVYAYVSAYIFVRIFKPYEDAIRKQQGIQEECEAQEE